jgi:hypothetical protein
MWKMKRKRRYFPNSSARLGIRISTWTDKNCRGIKRTVMSFSSSDFRHSLPVYTVQSTCKHRHQSQL